MRLDFVPFAAGALAFLWTVQCDPDFDGATLKERLDGTLWSDANDAGNALERISYSRSQFLPEHLDIFCAQMDGKEGLSHRTCRLRNLCIDFEMNNFFWLPIRKAGTDADGASLRSGTDPLFFPFVSEPSVNPVSAGEELVITVDNPVILFAGFVFDNIYHVVHEDLFPLLMMTASFEELRRATGNANKSSLDRLLVHVNGQGPDRYSSLYGLLGILTGLSELVQSVKEAHPKATKLCFQSLYVGAVNRSLWFPLNQGRSYGPSPLYSLNEIGGSVSLVTSWFRRRLGMPARDSYAPKDACKALLNSDHASDVKICLVARSKTRITVNQDEVVQGLRAAFPGSQIVLLADEDESKVGLLRQAASCSVIVAAHGALLIAAAFMPAGALVYEVFPYGLYDAGAVQCYKLLSDLPGMKMHYRSSHSPLLETGHELAEKNIKRRLPPSFIDGIRRSAASPKAPCCYNPFPVYKLSQNIQINVEHLIASLRDMMQEELATA